MIKKEAIDSFLNTQLDEWDWVKNLSKTYLETEIEDLTEQPVELLFKTKPFKHQLAGFLVGLYNESFMFYYSMGLGKSKIISDLFSFYKSVGAADVSLILCPNLTSISNWAEQIETHSALSYTELIGSKEERFDQLDSASDVFITNYQALPVFVCDRVKKGYKINERKLKVFGSMFNFICFDESQKLKNWNSLTFKICDKLARDSDFVYCLTGTPMNRDPHDLWTQSKIIDGGKSFGNSLGIFREAFFKQEQTFWGGFEYKLNKGAGDIISKRIKHRSLRYAENEAVDLPKVSYIKEVLDFPKENKEQYDAAVKGLIESQGDYRTLDNIFVRLRQICSGFISFKNSDDERIVVDFDENPKLECLVDLIHAAPNDSKIVVFNTFIKSGDIICTRLRKEKIGHVRLFGATKNKADVVSNFKNQDNIKVLVLNTQSGSVSLNLQIANYVVFYESPVSCIDRQQATKRVDRIGQTKKVFIYDLVMRSSIENKILQYLKEGKDLFRELIESKNIKKMLKST